MKHYRLEVNTYELEDLFGVMTPKQVPEISQIITTGLFPQVKALQKFYQIALKKSGPKVPDRYVVKFEIKEV